MIARSNPHITFVITADGVLLMAAEIKTKPEKNSRNNEITHINFLSFFGSSLILEIAIQQNLNNH